MIVLDLLVGDNCGGISVRWWFLVKIYHFGFVYSKNLTRPNLILILDILILLLLKIYIRSIFGS